MYFENLVGKNFEKLTVIELAPKTKNRSILWKCICECGNSKIAKNKNLIEGITTDCGCISKQGYKEGQKIARLRREKNYTQEDLAKNGMELVKKMKDTPNECLAKLKELDLNLYNNKIIIYEICRR